MFHFHCKFIALASSGGEVMGVIKGHEGGYSCNATTFPPQFNCPSFQRTPRQDTTHIKLIWMPLAVLENRRDSHFGNFYSFWLCYRTAPDVIVRSGSPQSGFPAYHSGCRQIQRQRQNGENAFMPPFSCHMLLDYMERWKLQVMCWGILTWCPGIDIFAHDLRDSCFFSHILVFSWPWPHMALTPFPDDCKEITWSLHACLPSHNPLPDPSFLVLMIIYKWEVM